MEAGPLEGIGCLLLGASLEQLPKREAESARLVWPSITPLAEEYREAIRPPTEKELEPWLIQRKLNAYAKSVQALSGRLRKAPPGVLDVIEQEPGMNPHLELERVAHFLILAGATAAKKKQKPHGTRPHSDAGQARERAKEFLIMGLYFEIVVWMHRPKTHVLPIAQVIHSWATKEAATEEGGTAMERLNKVWGKPEFDRLVEYLQGALKTLELGESRR